MRFAHFVISLPLLLGASQLTPLSSATAAPMDAAQATELLAKSHAIDVKCGVLEADQSQDLKDFVARAEISLAEKASVSVARKTIAGGKSSGKTAVCNDAAKKLVNDVLAAASAAATAPIEDATTKQPDTQAAVPEARPVATKQPQNKTIAVAEPAPAPKPAPVVVKQPKIAKIAKPVAPIKVVTAVKPFKPIKTVQPAKGLAGYAAVAEKYYVATRCGSMSRVRINALYKNVLSNHQQALASNRPQDVRLMLQSAEARAEAKSCG
jgi:hypothetical protein